jgi:hypothetical protein
MKVDDPHTAYDLSAQRNQRGGTINRDGEAVQRAA